MSRKKKAFRAIRDNEVGLGSLKLDVPADQLPKFKRLLLKSLAEIATQKNQNMDVDDL